MPSKETTGKTLRITLVKSPIGYKKDQKKTARALGLYRMNQTVEHMGLQKRSEENRARARLVPHESNGGTHGQPRPARDVEQDCPPAAD